MRYGSLCSGVEAATLAWEPLGWQPAWFSEIEPFPCAVLAYRWPKVPNLGDMTKINGDDYRGSIDLLVGGTPCQGFSLAGKRGGLADQRSGLARNFIGLVKSIRPRWIVWENVPGVFSSWSGEPEDEAEEWEATNDFDQFTAGLAECGYGLAWRVLDVQYVRVDGFGRAVPQRRRRVFVVGYLGDRRSAAAVLFDICGLRGDPAPCRQAGTGVARSVTASTGGASGKEQQQTFVGAAGPLNTLTMSRNFLGGYDHSEVAGTVDAGEEMHRQNLALGYDGRGYGNGITSPALMSDAMERVGDFFPLIMSTGQGNSEVNSGFSLTLNCDHEAPVVMSFGWNKSSRQTMNVDEHVTDTLKASRCAEPAVLIGVETGQGFWNQDEISGTIRAEGKNRPSRPSNIICYESGPGFWRDENVSGTVKTNGREASTVVGIAGAVAQTLKGEAFDGSEDGTGRGTPIIAYDLRNGCTSGEVGQTLSTGHDCKKMPVVALAMRGRDGDNVPELGGEVANALRNGQGGSDKGMVLDTVVRRLTPLECERLMGFPDFHTLIPWRVPKKIDLPKQLQKPEWSQNFRYLLSHGFTAEAAAVLAFTPDSPRYKACGNSIGVNVMRWIGRRIEMIENLITHKKREN